MPLEFLFCVLGFLVSWIYLRYFKKYDSSSIGDRSESFSFVSFFPDRFHSFIRKITFAKPKMMATNNTSNIIIPSLNLAIPKTTSSVEDLIVSDGNSLMDAERKRAIALKALEDRLAYLKSKREERAASKNDQKSP